MGATVGAFVIDAIAGEGAAAAAGAVVTDAVGGAVIGGAVSGVTGGNVGQGMLMGAAGGAVGGAISGSGASTMSSQMTTQASQDYTTMIGQGMSAQEAQGALQSMYGITPAQAADISMYTDMGVSPTAISSTINANNAATGGVLGSGLSSSQVAQGAKGLLGIMNGINGNKAMTPAQAQTMADPFGSSRQTYVNQLNSLMANPSLTMSQPGYQFQMQQGAQQLQAQLAKTGQSNAGAAGVALQQYGQNYATNAYQTYLNQLATLSGATQSPSAGASAALSAQQQKYNQQTAYDTALSQGIGALGQAFGGKSNANGTVTTAYNNPTVTSNVATPSSNDWASVPIDLSAASPSSLSWFNSNASTGDGGWSSIFSAQ